MKTLEELLDHPELLSKETLVMALRYSIKQTKEAHNEAEMLSSGWIISCEDELLIILAGTEDEE